jgi:AraC-like DNA-binding protein
MTQQEAGLLLQIRNYIIANLHRPLPVATICRLFHINKTKLQGQFREIAGCSLHAFMLQQRMQQAARRLQETDEPVKRIAWECGYRNVRSFNKTFKNYWQFSPDHFRKMRTLAESNTRMAKSDTTRLAFNYGDSVI